MRRALVVTTAAGAVLVAGLAAAPALAAGRGYGNGPGGAGPGTTWTCPVLDGTGAAPGAGTGPGARRGPGGGMGPGAGMGPGTGMGPGNGTGYTLPAQGTLTAAQKAGVAAMAEEEKLAHDVYVALARTSGDVRFTRVAAAETRHLALVRQLLTRYGIADPTAGRADGSFATAAVQKQYDAFVARGDDSPAAALAVGRDVEKADLDGLRAARAGVTAPDVLAVYDRLAAGSQRHLQAFSR